MKSNPPTRSLPFGPVTACALAAFCLTGAAIALAGAAPGAIPAPRPGPAQPAAAADADESIPSVLPGRPDLPAQKRSDAPNGALGRRFDSLSGGISLRPPAGMKALREVGKSDIVAFVTDAGPEKPAAGARVSDPVVPAPAPAANPGDSAIKLVVRRETFPAPQPLVAAPDEKGVVHPGLLENTVDALLRHVQGDAPIKDFRGNGQTKHWAGARVLRQDLTNLGNHDVGMIVLRYTKDAQRRLAQHAIIQANDQLYYVLSLTTPARKLNAEAADAKREAELEESCEDPVEAQAVELFRAVLDSVTLLDRKAIVTDQTERLFRTRTMLFNLTPQKLASSLVPEQWLRIVRQEDNGGWRDIGYQYVSQEIQRRGGQDNVYVGIRTRVIPGGPGKPFPRIESSANHWSTFDRKQETWSKLTAHDDGKPKTAENPWFKITEFGNSMLTTDQFAADPRQIAPGAPGDPHQAPVVVKDTYKLTVHHATSKGDFNPIERPLPPFYMPQALGTILPQLLPHREAKTYLIASYVSDAREVMLRYIDVLPEQEVTLVGRKIRAIPIRDRVGLEGSAWTHYVSNTGRYLGSDSKESRTAILVSSEKTLKKLWEDADLRRPDDVNRDAARHDGATETPVYTGVPGTPDSRAPRNSAAPPPAPRRASPR